MEPADSNFNEIHLNLKGFKVYPVGSGVSSVPSYNRRDFFKICVTNGHHRIKYAAHTYEHKEPILFLANPAISYTWEVLSSIYDGYACVFTQDFMGVDGVSLNLGESRLFKTGTVPVMSLIADQSHFITSLFEKMILESKSEYRFKDELIRNYVNLIFQEALKLQPHS